MNKKINENFDDFLQNIEDRLKIKIDRGSLDFDVFKSLFLMNKSNDDKVTSFLDEMNFENYSGNKLTKFLSYFNINRLGGTSLDIYEFIIINNSNYGIKFQEDSCLEFENYYYRMIKPIYAASKKNVKIAAQKIYKKIGIEEPLFSNEGNLKFDKTTIIVDDGVDIHSIFNKEVKLYSFTHIPDNIENDYELFQKGKKLMQLLGQGNNKIIETLLYEDERIKNITFSNNSFGNTEITIIPENLDEVENIINSVNEIVDYYRNERIIVKKPNIIKIEIEGLTPSLRQIDDAKKIITDVKNEIFNYLSLISIEGHINSLDILNIITKAVSEYDISLNTSGIDIMFRYYSNKNYINHIFEQKMNGILKLKNNEALVLGKIS